MRAGAEFLLVDAGAGSNLVPTAGKLDARLRAAGIDPGSITKVVITDTLPLEQVQTALEMCQQTEGGRRKVVLAME